MTQDAIVASPTWQAKLAEEASIVAEAQEQALQHWSTKAERLDAAIPKWTDLKGRGTVLLDNTDKQLIIMYAFIGLSELVAASGTMTQDVIWRACIERSIHNLKKDGLIK